MEYKWEILKLNVVPSVDGLENVVKSVNWRFMARDGMFYGDVYDITELSYPESQNFIKYDDLDEHTVIEWVKNNIDFENAVAKAVANLEENKNPTILEKDPPFIKEERYSGDEEYLIVIDGDLNKLWGPLKWNTNRANAGLVHYGITDYKFPYDITMFQKELLPVDTPFVVNDRITVYRVEYSDPPETYDELLEYKGNLTWIFDTGKAVGTYYIHQRTIEEVKEVLIDIALTKYNQMRLENVVEFNVDGNLYKASSDDNTLAFIYTAGLILKNRETATIKIPNTLNYIKFDKNMLELFSNKVYDHLHSIILQEKTVVEAIKAASSIEELKQIEV